MTAVQPVPAIPDQATDLPEPLRPARSRTDYWDAADACWRCGGTDQIPAQRSTD